MVSESGHRAYDDAIGYPGPLDHLSSYQGWIAAGLGVGTVSTSQAWPFTTSYKIFKRVWNPREFRSTHAYITNGAVVSGNWDIGVYTIYGDRIASVGTTAQAGTSQTQFASLVATIPAGRLLLVLQVSSGTAEFAYPSPSVSFWPNSFFDVLGWGYDHTTGGGLPLPAVITPITGSGFGSINRMPIFGVLKRWPE